MTALDGLARVFKRVQATDVAGKRLAVPAALERTVALVLRQAKAGRKVIFIGNGGSAAIASHQSVDLWKNGGVKATAFNDASLLTCVSNDFGYRHVFEKPVGMFAEAGDVLIAISSSGKSENILRGVAAGRARRTHVVTMSGFKRNNPLRSKGDVNFYVPSGDYGPVEITHLALCHAVTDAVMERNA